MSATIPPLVQPGANKPLHHSTSQSSHLGREALSPAVTQFSPAISWESFLAADTRESLKIRSKRSFQNVKDLDIVMEREIHKFVF